MSMRAVDGAVRAGCESLGIALGAYAPSDKRNMIAEQNAVVHVAAALNQRGWMIFAEAQSARRVDGRIRRCDLVALQRQWCLVAEAKRLFREPEQLVYDFGRVSDFEPIGGLGTWQRLGLLLALTGEPLVAEWFDDPAWKAAPPGWGELDNLADKMQVVAPNRSRWGSLPVGARLWLTWVVWQPVKALTRKPHGGIIG